MKFIDTKCKFDWNIAQIIPGWIRGSVMRQVAKSAKARLAPSIAPFWRHNLKIINMTSPVTKVWNLVAKLLTMRWIYLCIIAKYTNIVYRMYVHCWYGNGKNKSIKNISISKKFHSSHLRLMLKQLYWTLHTVLIIVTTLTGNFNFFWTHLVAEINHQGCG